MRNRKSGMSRRREVDDLAKAEERSSAGKNDRGLPASKKYLVNPEFSRTPVAKCECVLLGLPSCASGEGVYCYQKKPCSSQAELSSTSEDITLTPEAKELYSDERNKALKHSRDAMKDIKDEDDMDLVIASWLDEYIQEREEEFSE